MTSGLLQKKHNIGNHRYRSFDPIVDLTATALILLPNKQRPDPPVPLY